MYSSVCLPPQLSPHKGLAFMLPRDSSQIPILSSVEVTPRQPPGRNYVHRICVVPNSGLMSLIVTSSQPPLLTK